jgi:long-subunit fatty acid transport protein
LNPSWTVRCGYSFDATPVPEKTSDPICPDADTDGVAIGLYFEQGKYELGLAYSGQFGRDRNINNNLDGFNGKYETSCHLIAMNFEFRLW